MRVLKERIDEIITLIAELANGNFDYQIDTSATGDELDAVIAGIGMLGQELKGSVVSRDFMESIYQGVVDMLLVLNTDFTIRNANDAFEEITGYKEEELINRPVFDFLRFEDNPDLSAHLKHFEDEGKYLNVELQLQAKQLLSVTCSFSYLKNSNQQKDGILIVAKDISDIKLKEKELQEAKEKAEAANEAKSNFLSSMSHEIRTPLNGILGFTYLLQETPLNETQKQYIDLIKTSGTTLSKLLNDILDFHKIEKDKIAVEEVPLEIRNTISADLEPYRFLAEDRNIRFSYTLDDAVPMVVLGDPVRLNQIFVNLMSNALKFTQAGSIDIKGELVSLDKEEEMAVLKFSVTDTGIGIPPEEQEAIFESFAQSEQASSGKYGGFGLGLTITKRLVNLMHGEIGVVSPPEGQQSGTSFWFTIKLKYLPDYKVELEEEAFDLDYRVKTGTRILVVDDNPINNLLMQDMLENLGANVLTAESGSEALQIVQNNMVDLIFMDVQMPEMDGLEATRALRKQSILIPIVAFSANAYKEDIAKSINAGMNDYLCKPFTNSELIAVLKKWL